MLERAGLYDLSIQALEVLLYGSLRGRAELHKKLPASTMSASPLAPLLLSRRARGKAIERLMIDYTHLVRRAVKLTSETGDGAEEIQGDFGSETSRTEVQRFCSDLLEVAVPSASISFASIRGIARRLKRPLGQSIALTTCFEAQKLGLRLDSPPSESTTVTLKKSRSVYSDWTPPVDCAVANAITNDATSGGRCAFTALLDDSSRASSLNVEEHALEYYRKGLFPLDDSSYSSPKGGWEGWHDEGGHLRALFRILGSSVVGFDWARPKLYRKDTGGKEEEIMVHVTPYQSCPFDLHTGFEIRPSQGWDDPVSRSFYGRRQSTIETFLSGLTRSSPQEICDLVYSSICARVQYHERSKDPSVQSDVKNMKSLALIAAGCGGAQLAAAFRCFFFDYRHYSGGLPDLTLVRGVYDDNGEIVDLSRWIGEGFDASVQADRQDQNGVAMLADEEFLGCNKVGDSAPSRRGRSSRRTNAAPPSVVQVSPAKLDLSLDGRRINPQCLFVEVKSSNDRLDPRQEDWLNILDRYGGNARVCKFVESRKSKKR